MKNKIENLSEINSVKETAKGESIEVMETVLFTNIIKKKIKSESILKYSDYISFIALENKIKVTSTHLYIFGKSSEIEKAQDKLIESLMCN